MDTSITVPSYNSGYSLGWDNVVLNCNPTNAPPYFGYGLYKVIIGDGRFLFYFDSRDCDYDGTYTCGNDFYFKYNYTYNSLQITTAGSCANINAVNGEYYNIWEIHEKITPPITNSFEDFWQNSLVLIPSQTGNHPRLVWGPYPSNNIIVQAYKVYRKYGSSPFAPCTTLSASIYQFTDESVYLSVPGGQAGTDVQYKVTAVFNTNNETSPTNTVTVNIQGDEIEKRSYSIPVTVYNYNLEQSYPNPFNPSTKINYSISQVGFVTLKVYDVLGKEVTTLVNEEKLSGNYEVSFNASNLSSGIYYYQIRAGEFVKTKKMLLLK